MSKDGRALVSRLVCLALWLPLAAACGGPDSSEVGRWAIEVASEDGTLVARGEVEDGALFSLHEEGGNTGLGFRPWGARETTAGDPLVELQVVELNGRGDRQVETELARLQLVFGESGTITTRDGDETKLSFTVTPVDPG